VLQSFYLKSQPDPVTLGQLEGETGNLGKCEILGIIILQMGDQILMKLNISELVIAKNKNNRRS